MNNVFLTCTVHDNKHNVNKSQFTKHVLKIDRIKEYSK